MRNRGRTVRMIAVAGVLSGAAVLGGCAQNGSTVASVDGTRITRSQLDQSMSGARQLSQTGQQPSSGQVLTIMIRGQIADQVARQRGIQISQADRDKQLNPAVLQVADARDLAYALADTQIVVNAVGQDGFKKALAAADVSVNPRFGTWDPKQTFGVQSGSGSLSQIAQNRPS